MKKYKKLIFKIVVFIFIIVVFILLNYFAYIKNSEKENNDIVNNTILSSEKDYMEMKNSSLMYNENSTLNDLKTEYKITGQDEIYQIDTESDGRKTIVVKPSINYKVAFCGMIKNAMPSFEELDSVFEKKSPTENGIWINENDREKIINYLNNLEKLSAKYEIDENGYLRINEKNNQTEYDKKIEKLINSSNQYIFSISSICYMVDTVTGDIIENPYNDLEEYQTYEYFRYNNKFIIFITENNEGKLTNNEIFESLMNLLDFIDT